MKKLISSHYLILAVILFLTFIFRFPSLYEPFWYGDEGIFGAVARNLNQGGTLYQTAWDNKPPMIYLTYAAIFKLFGVSIFWLRLVTLITVLATVALIYEIAQVILSRRRALIAAFLFGFLTSLRLIEGNLALTEIFMVLPISLAMLWTVKGNFKPTALFGAGVLFSVASLYKQVGALEAAALGVYLILISKNFGQFFKKGLMLSIGFLIPHLITVTYFAPKNLLDDYIFAAYTYYNIYLGESPKYALLINVLKFLPIISAITYGFYKKIRNEINLFHLILLWAAFSFLGGYFSGRTYGHYLVQAVPAVSLLLSSVRLDLRLKPAQLVFGLSFFIPLFFLTKLLFTDFLSGGPINQIKYWHNFSQFTSGKKGVDAYNDFFDTNVNSIMGLADFLKEKEAIGQYVYIWGDYPWLYAIADLKNPTKYVTSFHVFGVPSGRDEVATDLEKNLPRYIIKPPTSIGNFSELEKLLKEKYTFVAQIENSKVWVRKD